MKVVTESGTVYEFTKDLNKFRRLRKRLAIDPEAVKRAELRQDGQWLSLFEKPNPIVGSPMILLVEPPESADVTVRMTTVVISVEE